MISYLDSGGDCGCPAHVGAHLVHLARGLDGDATGVKGDALANQHNRVGVLDIKRLASGNFSQIVLFSIIVNILFFKKRR